MKQASVVFHHEGSGATTGGAAGSSGNNAGNAASAAKAAPKPLSNQPTSLLCGLQTAPEIVVLELIQNRKGVERTASDQKRKIDSSGA